MSERELVIQVTAGDGEPPAMRATPGREVGPVSIGAAGAWRLNAPGVADKHAYLFYDGKRLFVQSCSLDLPAMVDGRPVPLDWTPVEAPCEIAMGEARLSFAEYQDVSVSELGDSDLGSYRSQDSMPSNGERLNGSGAPPDVNDDSGVTRIEDITERTRGALAAQMQQALMKPTPAAGMPPSGAEGMLPDDGDAPTRIHGDQMGPGIFSSTPGAPIPASVRAAAAAAVAGVSNSQGSYAASAVILPSSGPQSRGTPEGPPPSGTGPIPPVSFPGWTGTQHLAGSAPPGPASNPGGAPHPAFGGAASPGMSVPGAAMPAAPSFGPPPAPGATPPAGSGPAAAPEKKSFWREASTPKKITLLMMPLVVMSVGVIFSDDPRALLGLEPRPTAAAKAPPTAAPETTGDPVASGETGPSETGPETEGELAAGAEGETADEQPPASASASTSASASAVASVAPPVKPPPAPTPAAKVAGRDQTTTKTLERQAADALQEGEFKLAAELYEKLAAENPDREVFREAAAIMRMKAGQ